MDLLTLVDRLEALVSEGWRIPFTVKTVINEDAFFEIIDQMRASVPEELRRAEELLERRESLLASAAAEAEQTLLQARERAERAIDEHEVVAKARAEGESLKAQAQVEAEQTRRGADDYAMGVLSELESRLSSLLRTTSNGLGTLKRRRAPAIPEDSQDGS